MATIVERPGPKGTTAFQAVVRRRGYPTRAKTFDRKTDAQKWARKIEHEMDTGAWKDTAEASRVTLAEALDRYLASVSVRKRPKTQVSEKKSAEYLRAAMGSLSLLQITPERVARYRDQRLEKLSRRKERFSPNSVRLELALLSHLFTIAEREWSFKGLENPLRRVQRPEIPEGRCPVLSEDQIARLLEECMRSTSPLLYEFALLCLHTGGRSFELRSLRWNQVDFKGGFITLTAEGTKGKRQRFVPLTDAALDMLKGIAERQGAGKVVDLSGKATGLVFPSRNNPNKPRDVHMAFSRASERAGLDNLPGNGRLRIHDLRHLCGTFLVMNGVDLETVRTILGHRDLSTTQKYLHVVNAHKRTAMQKIGHLGIAVSEVKE